MSTNRQSFMISSNVASDIYTIIDGVKTGPVPSPYVVPAGKRLVCRAGDDCYFSTRVDGSGDIRTTITKYGATTDHTGFGVNLFAPGSLIVLGAQSAATGWIEDDI